MSYTATITSKRQLTIPAKLFRELGFEEGQKVSLTKQDDGSIIIQDDMMILEKLAGSVEVPDHLKGVDIDEQIKSAIEMEYGNKK